MQGGEKLYFEVVFNHWKMLDLQHQYNNCTTIPHMRVGPSMWDPPLCERLLYNCCIGVVNLTFSIYIYIEWFLHSQCTTCALHQGTMEWSLMWEIRLWSSVQSLENVRFTTPIQQLYNNPSHEGGPQILGPTLMWEIVVQLLYWCCKSNIFHIYRVIPALTVHNMCTTPRHNGVESNVVGLLWEMSVGIISRLMCGPHFIVPWCSTSVVYYKYFYHFSIYIRRNDPYTHFSQQPHNKLTWLVIFYYFFVLFSFLFVKK
jgi:hypothetical protein